MLADQFEQQNPGTPHVPTPHTPSTSTKSLTPSTSAKSQPNSLLGNSPNSENFQPTPTCAPSPIPFNLTPSSESTPPLKFCDINQLMKHRRIAVMN